MRNIETEELVDIYAKYPAHPEEPMSDSQQHYNAITRLGENLLIMFTDRQHEVGVFCDLAWYPTESGDNKAPDVMVVFGVPQDRTPPRQSFAQPLEGVGPSVVFELSSNSNTYAEIETKRVWYQEHGVEEYYWIDETRNRVDVFIRENDELVEQEGLADWVSPLLGIRIAWSNSGVRVYMPNGTLMRSPRLYYAEQQELTEQERQRADIAEERAELAEEEVEEQRARLETETRRADRYEDLLFDERQRTEEEAQRAQQAAQRAEQEAQRAEQEAQRAQQAAQRAEQEAQRAQQEAQRAQQEAQRAQQEAQRAQQEAQARQAAEQRAEQLAALLRQMGVDPDNLPPT